MGFLRKVWKFIWEDDSALSWIVNVILAFVIVKFLIYPGLGLVLHTTHPVVAVVSGSMDHGLNKGEICGITPEDYQGSLTDYWIACGAYYDKIGITKEMFNEYRFKNGFNKGDIMVLKGVKIENVKVGDVIVFDGRSSSDPIIHRVIKVYEVDGKKYAQTKGDHNSDSSPLLGEDKISQEKLVGIAVARIPLLGWVKIGFVEIINGFRGRN
ncbi:MAG TPA: signal peptidase I [Candidatus Nanoarchaeia archaeon]|nr:signal peptidase I [Candidatus Nanoarchaeia archaeon]